MRDVKHKVHFVPDCVAITHTANRTWNQITEFTNRQMIMTFHMGTLAAMGHKPHYVSAERYLRFSDPSHFYFTEENCCLSPLSLFWKHSAIGSTPKTYRAGSKTCRRCGRQLELPPTLHQFPFLLAGINAVYSVFQRKITWGGVRYEILSATKCRVFRHGKAKTGRQRLRNGRAQHFKHS